MGAIGSVEVLLASCGSMPITGLQGKPSNQGQNERTHQTLTWFLNANRPKTLERLRERITRYREHCNDHRSHQALEQAIPPTTWEHIIEHVPTTEPIPPANRQVYYQCYRFSLSIIFAGRRYYRSISAEEFLLADPDTLEVVFSLPLPMMDLDVRGKFMASYSIQGPDAKPDQTVGTDNASFREQFSMQTQALPAVFETQEVTS